MLSDREAGWFWGTIGRGKEVLRGEKKVGRLDGLAKGIPEALKREYVEALQELEREARGGGGS